MLWLAQNCQSFRKYCQQDSPTQSQQSQQIVYLDLASSACKFPNLVLNHSCASRRFSETCRKIEIELINKLANKGRSEFNPQTAYPPILCLTGTTACEKKGKKGKERKKQLLTIVMAEVRY